MRTVPLSWRTAQTAREQSIGFLFHIWVDRDAWNNGATAGRVTPPPPYVAVATPNSGNSSAELQPVTISMDVSSYRGCASVPYTITAQPVSGHDNELSVSWIATGDQGGSATITNNVAFPVGVLGMMITLSWASNASPVLNNATSDIWTVDVTFQLWGSWTYCVGFQTPVQFTDVANYAQDWQIANGGTPITRTYVPAAIEFDQSQVFRKEDTTLDPHDIGLTVDPTLEPFADYVNRQWPLRFGITVYRVYRNGNALATTGGI